MLKDLKTLFDERFQGRRKFEDFLACRSADHVKKNVKGAVRSYVADDELRAFQLFLSSVVVDYLRIESEAVFSYRKGKNIADAVRGHANSKYFFKADLRQFFSSIDEKLVEITIRESFEFLPFCDAEHYLGQIVQLLTHKGHLPPGFATSPGISNACLYKLDKRLRNEAEKRNLIYTRYSDDIIFSGGESKEVGMTPFLIDTALHDLYDGQFYVNLAKSKFLRKGAKVRLLGLLVLPNGHVTLDRKAKNNIETLLHFYATDGLRFLQMTNANLEKGALKLSGHLNYIQSIDPAYIEKLKKKYGEATVDSLKKLLTAGF